MHSSPSTLLTSYTLQREKRGAYILLREIEGVYELLEDIGLPVNQLLLEGLEELGEPGDDDFLVSCLNVRAGKVFGIRKILCGHLQSCLPCIAP